MVLPLWSFRPLQALTTRMTVRTSPASENDAIVIDDVDGDGPDDGITAAIRQSARHLFRHRITQWPLIRTATDMTLSEPYLQLPESDPDDNGY
jgi:hypothetical protein